MEGAILFMLAIWLALCMASFGAVLAYQIPKWRRREPERARDRMVLGALLGGITFCVMVLNFLDEGRPLALAAGSLAGGAALGLLAGRRGLEASAPVIAPALVTAGWLANQLLPRETIWPTVPAIAFIPLAAYMIGRVPWRTVRLVAAALVIAAPFQYQAWAERRALADEARAVQTDLTGAIERSGLWLVFERVPDVKWQPVAPNPAAQAFCNGTILSREGKLDFTPGKLGIDLRLASPIVMKVGPKSAMRIVDPDSLRANGLRTDMFANFVRLNESGPLESVRHLGGPAQRFTFERAGATIDQDVAMNPAMPPPPYGGSPLGELYIRGDRARIEIFGWARYEEGKVRWNASAGMGDPR